MKFLAICLVFVHQGASFQANDVIRVPSKFGFRHIKSKPFKMPLQNHPIHKNLSSVLMATPILENWILTNRNEVSGIVRNHPDKDIYDGELLTTSTLATKTDQVREGAIVVTASGSKYKLGKQKANAATIPTKVSGNSFFGGNRVPILNEWTVTANGAIKGIVKNHPDPDIQNGEELTTSPIRESRDSLKTGQIITTSTGSIYRLGTMLGGSTKSTQGPFAIFGKKAPGVQFTKVMASNTTKGSNQVSNTALKKKLGLNGKMIGDGKYLLAGKGTKSTSGRSMIWTAYAADSDGNPTGEPLTIKISSNIEAVKRESNNYNRVTSGLFPGRFVTKYDFFENLSDDSSNEFSNQCALVMESGIKDLKSILQARRGRGYEDRAMRDAAVAAIQCVQAMHSSGLVWTDLKTENFVITSKDIEGTGGLPGVKGIDLESAILRGKAPVDFSPEACPPEFAKKFIEGKGYNFKLDYSYDIWSYGMMLYEIATGRCYFGNQSPAVITKSLAKDDFEVDVSDVADPKLRDLIASCLDTNPKKRPGINRILLHPYFLSTGIGPYGF